MQKIREKYPNVQAEVITIINYFFGESITVSGLITGKDLMEQLEGRDLGDCLLLPCNMLRSGKKRLSRRCDGGRGGRAPENTGTDYR